MYGVGKCEKEGKSWRVQIQRAVQCSDNNNSHFGQTDRHAGQLNNCVQWAEWALGVARVAHRGNLVYT